MLVGDNFTLLVAGNKERCLLAVGGRTWRGRPRTAGGRASGHPGTRPFRKWRVSLTPSLLLGVLHVFHGQVGCPGCPMGPHPSLFSNSWFKADVFGALGWELAHMHKMRKKPVPGYGNNCTLRFWWAGNCTEHAVTTVLKLWLMAKRGVIKHQDILW